MSTYEKIKIRSKGVMWGHVTHFWNFGIPLYLWNLSKKSGVNQPTTRYAVTYYVQIAKHTAAGIRVSVSVCDTVSLLMGLAYLWIDHLKKNSR